MLPPRHHPRHPHHGLPNRQGTLSCDGFMPSKRHHQDRMLHRYQFLACHRLVPVTLLGTRWTSSAAWREQSSSHRRQLNKQGSSLKQMHSHKSLQLQTQLKCHHPQATIVKVHLHTNKWMPWTKLPFHPWGREKSPIDDFLSGRSDKVATRSENQENPCKLH